jgi:periplasmic protein TonB
MFCKSHLNPKPFALYLTPFFYGFSSAYHLNTKSKAMTSQQILKADLLDILFENRNKEYGAYKLRREYPSHLKKAVGIMLLFVSALFMFSMIKPPSVQTNRPGTDTTIVELENIKENIPKKQEQPQQERTVEKAPPTKENPIFKIIDDKLITKPISENVDTSDIATGPVNSPGNGGEGYVAGKEDPKTLITPVVEPTPPVEPEIYDASAVNELPQFPGGDDAWMKYLQRMLRVPDDMEEGERKTVKVKFVVNADGDVTDAVIIQTAGNTFDREVLRVINRMPKWKPGKQRGRPVAVYFTQPVTFTAQSE